MLSLLTKPSFREAGYRSDAGHSRLLPGARLTLIATAVTLWAVGCDGSGSAMTQPQARDNAANAVCDYAARCGNIGAAPATYPTRDSCVTTWKANIENLWPLADCGKIQQAEYNTCVASIKDGTCSNGLDLLTILSKCGKSSICAAP